MAEAAIAVSIFSAVAGFAGQQIQRRQMKKAAANAQAEERKQRALANRQAALERRRSIRQAIAQARVQRAQAIQQGFTLGGGGDSSVPQGLASSIGSDLGASIGASQTQFAAQSGIAMSQDRQGNAMQAFQNAQGGNFLTAASQLGGALTSVAGIWGGGNPFEVAGTTGDNTPLFGVAR
jgi:hypothetical protein